MFHEWQALVIIVNDMYYLDLNPDDYIVNLIFKINKLKSREYVFFGGFFFLTFVVRDITSASA